MPSDIEKARQVYQERRQNPDAFAAAPSSNVDDLYKIARSTARAREIREAPDLFREGERKADIERREQRRRRGRASTMLTSPGGGESATNLLGL